MQTNSIRSRWHERWLVSKDRWTLPENVAKIFDKAELTREATTSAASLLNFTPEKVRRSRLSLPPPPPAGESFTDGGCPASVAATADPVAPAAGSNASKRKGRGSLSPERCGDFDVYNIETSMPTIDWDAMERHLSRAAKEDDWLARLGRKRREGRISRRLMARAFFRAPSFIGPETRRQPIEGATVLCSAFLERGQAFNAQGGRCIRQGRAPTRAPRERTPPARSQSLVTFSLLRGRSPYRRASPT
ncbi:hypothetical protein HPB48_019685 [Haemaphysalis longicornis]|uniref:Uncharacterized protein n=1 Tax=Haemaphysalis longicornis TaxID=44386 RepID=A0A9J6G4Z5_HAELO|nr:hypothetical protein HPB48_019685 [Haemaphysalis longicornis]